MRVMIDFTIFRLTCRDVDRILLSDARLSTVALERVRLSCLPVDELISSMSAVIGLKSPEVWVDAIIFATDTSIVSDIMLNTCIAGLVCIVKVPIIFGENNLSRCI